MLLEKGLQAGKDRGIAAVHGTVPADNAQMPNLARETDGIHGHPGRRRA
jgi:hypothetical protein